MSQSHVIPLLLHKIKTSIYVQQGLRNTIQYLLILIIVEATMSALVYVMWSDSHKCQLCNVPTIHLSCMSHDSSHAA